MIEDLLPALEADLLFVIVVGPSFGESIGVRVPPDRWMLIDSLSARPRRGRPPGQGLTPLAGLLDRLNATADVIALTHPHLDQCLGLDLLVDQFASGAVGCLGLWPDEVGFRVRDGAWRQAENVRDAALASIKTRWEENRDSEWRLKAGERRWIGDEAEVEVLFPDDNAVDAQKARGVYEDTNASSRPMLVSWRGARVLLGADLTASPGWESVATAYAALDDHAVLKVPHHTSREAQHPAFLTPVADRQRVWISTPWHLGGRRLPNLEACDGPDETCHGPARLLRYSDEIYLTTHGQWLTAELPARRLSREQLAAISGGGPNVNDAEPVPPPPAPAAHDAWIAVGIDGDGGIREVLCGPESVVLTPP